MRTAKQNANCLCRKASFLRLAAVCVLLLTGLGIVVEAQNTGRTVRRHRIAEDENYLPALAKAEAAIEAKQYATAEQELEKLATSHPDNYRIWFDLGLVYSETQREPKAIEAYRKAVAADPKVLESQMNLGLLLVQEGEPGAETHLRTALELQAASESPAARSREVSGTLWLALAHDLEKDKPEQALHAYQEAAKYRATDPRLHLAAAAVAERLKNWKVAEDEYIAARAGGAHGEESLTGLVNVYLATRQFAKAEPLLRDLAEKSPQDHSIRLLLGRLLLAQGRLEEAQPELEAGLEGSNDPRVRRELVQLYLDAKQYGKAAEQLQILLRENPNDAELHARLGSALLQQRRFSEAQNALLAALKLNPDNATAYIDLAMAASENQDYVLTIRALDARAQFKPEEPGTYFLRAIAYDHLKDFEHAAENYRRFLEVADNKFPDQEWQARHRLNAIDPRKSR